MFCLPGHSAGLLLSSKRGRSVTEPQRTRRPTVALHSLWRGVSRLRSLWRCHRRLLLASRDYRSTVSVVAASVVTQTSVPDLVATLMAGVFAVCSAVRNHRPVLMPWWRSAER